MSYWSAAGRRVGPALFLGAVVGLLGLVWGPTEALFLGGLTALAAVLLPVRRAEDER
jgi:hypothetical protein